MIVNHQREGFEVIYQQAHALLALQFASRWRKEHRPVRWLETLLALVEHDDGQADFGRDTYLTDAGAPLDFSQQTFALEDRMRVTQLARFKSRWSALLISMHMSFLYEEKRAENAKVAAYLDEQLENQARWRKELKATKKEAQWAYDLMQFCDRLSLILCRREIPEAQRALEISLGPDGTRHDITQRPDESLQITPWCFDEAAFTVSVEAHYLTQLSFKNDAELLDALRTCPVKELTWEVRK